MMSKDKLAQVFHFDLYGKREDKYDFLNENSLESIDWKELDVDKPSYFFVKKDFQNNSEYLDFVKITDLFPKYSAGIQTKRDSLFIDENADVLKQRIRVLLSGDFDKDFIENYNIYDSTSYKLTQKIKKVVFREECLIRLHYRPFDNRFIYYDPELIGRSFFSIMRNLQFNDNLGLVASKQFVDNFKYVSISNGICDMNLISNAGSFGAGFSFPLYLYPETNAQLSIGESQARVPNLNMAIVNKIAEGLNMHFRPEENPEGATVEVGQFHPIDILDYIYAVLHSPAYREKYKEFLKIDFPRVPYPSNPRTFFDLIDLGRQLRELHLLESPEVENYLTQYPIDGDNVVVKPRFISPLLDGCPQDGVVGNVFINETQYFANVPLTAWEFYIGGYQPAQKWLKDRKGRELSFEDILHYQKMIVALKRTSELMVEVDGVMSEQDF